MRNIPVQGFKGLNNVELDSYLQRFDDLGRLRVFQREINNIDVGNFEEIRRADGYAKLLDFTNAHSLWMFEKLGYGLFIENNNLRLLWNDNGIFQTSILRNDCYSGNSLYCLDIYDRVYYSDGIISGIVKEGINMNWGLDIPKIRALTSIGGQLKKGLYRIALTYMRYDGVESGASQVTTFNVTQDGNEGIYISFEYPFDDNITLINIYVSAPDGEELYLTSSIRKNYNGSWQTSFSYDSEYLTLPLDKIGLNKPPVGQLLELYNQRIYIAQNNVLFYTEPLNYELYNEVFNFFPFDTKITMIMSSGTGLYISTVKDIYYLTGAMPEQFRYNKIYDYGIFEGMFVNVGTKEINQQNIDFYGVTERGIVAGKGGAITNITENYFRPELIAKSGWRLYREKSDLRQIYFCYQAQREQHIEATLPKITGQMNVI
jgi:hypothetical protein